MFQRSAFDGLLKRFREPRRFLQVLAGPRQIGKTTLARQILDGLGLPSHYASADVPALPDRNWIEQQWELARLRVPRRSTVRGAVLVLDEIQKISGWSTAVKGLWDADTAARLPLKVLLLGSSPWLIQRGLADSLAGRFEITPLTHWSFAEMKAAFGVSLEEYVFYGGYPGAAALTADPPRWSRYILDSLVETTIARDILLMTRVDKPALLRQLFRLGCTYSGEVLSYQKMLGQLQDAGNTTTLAHYLELLSGAGFLTGLPKLAGARNRLRGSSPKLLVLNTALMTATTGLSPADARRDREFWGRLVESAVGAHLLSGAAGTTASVSYWRDRGAEVDFVLQRGERVVALEMKSGRAARSLPGMAAFRKEYPGSRPVLVGGEGMPIGEFLETPPTHWLG